ncbi:hypothetical protein Cni_G08878 [Canna indica]|uniref:Uncharacterized protein n=1 Tax=Canna indica TaxID=4628 RepID=A0AAQ3Q937_9LILI|nr:hypothetical protein Cni_G08878 [Canna indica]
MQKPGASLPAPSPVLLKLRSQRHKVQRLKEESLWNKSFDKAVDLMVCVVITVFSRVYTVFGIFVLGQPPPLDRNSMLRGSLDLVDVYSGPLESARMVTLGSVEGGR